MEKKSPLQGNIHGGIKIDEQICKNILMALLAIFLTYPSKVLIWPPTFSITCVMVRGPRCEHLYLKIKVLIFEQKIFSEKCLFLTIYLIL